MILSTLSPIDCCDIFSDENIPSHLHLNPEKLLLNPEFYFDNHFWSNTLFLKNAKMALREYLFPFEVLTILSPKLKSPPYPAKYYSTSICDSDARPDASKNETTLKIGSNLR